MNEEKIIKSEVDLLSAAIERIVSSEVLQSVMSEQLPLYQLPYSVEAVLELRTTTRREKCTYNKAYPYYGTLEHAASEMDRSDRILTEDSNSG